MRRAVLVVAAVLVAGCGGPADHRPEPGCSGHGGVVRFEVHDGVAYFACRDGAVGRL